MVEVGYVRAEPDEHPFGYHMREIKKGVLGEVSKIVEEAQETEDAALQANPVMVLTELSDLVGAVQAYLRKHHPSINIDDLITMADATRRAFESGRRS